MAPTSGDGAGGRGYAVPVVKVEDDGLEDKPSKAEEAATKAEGDEGVDFGGDEKNDEELKEHKAGTKPKPELQRALPDYTDLIDADADGGMGEVKEDCVKEQPVEQGERRPEAIHISCVQRLTRTHLAEVFASKNLPQFGRVDWIGDEDCICIFPSALEAATALKGAQAGFGDTAAESDTPPGPGLWRAQRGMLDFRYATTTDKPELGWKKQHRGGRQVREFRFWEAIKSVDKDILAQEDAKIGKRKDLITELPKDYDRPAKRARTEGDESLLEKMAMQDKDILGGGAGGKDAEDEDDDRPWPAEWEQQAKANAVRHDGDMWIASDDAYAHGQWQRRPGRRSAWQGPSDDRRAGKGRNGKGGGWQHDDRDGAYDEWSSWTEGDRQTQNNPRKGRHKGGDDEEPPAQADSGRAGGKGRGRRNVMASFDVDDDEEQRRSKRNERFHSASRSQVPEPGDDERSKRQRRAERFASVTKSEV